MPQSPKVGICPCCHRRTRLTFHHLIPKKMHRRKRFKKQYSKTVLNEGIAVCRLCHNGIHRFYSEMELAQHFASLAALKKDPALANYFAWVAKQRVRVE